MDVHLGWWVVPAAVTVLVFGLAWWKRPRIHDGFMMDIAGRLLATSMWMTALAVSLSAWLVWAVVR